MFCKKLSYWSKSSSGISFPDSILAMSGNTDEIRDFSPNEFDLSPTGISLTTNTDELNDPSIVRYGDSSFKFLGSNFNLSLDAEFMNEGWQFQCQFRFGSLPQYGQFFSILQTNKRFNLTIVNGNSIAVINQSAFLATYGGLTANTWYHLLVGNDGDPINPKIYTFLDGSLLGSVNAHADFLNFVGNGNLILGNNVSVPTQSFNGYIDDILLEKKPVITEAFTPPSQSLII